VRIAVRVRTWAIAAGDVACFVLFALVGLRSHEEGISGSGMLRVVLPFAGAWAVTAWATGVYRQPRSLRRLLLAWLPAWAVGLIIRSIIFDRSLLSAFSVIALLFNAVLLSLWHLLAGLLGGAREPEARPSRASPPSGG
jgi:hypothetical protein